MPACDIACGPVVETWTCKIILATSKGWARKMLMYFHTACSRSFFTTSVGVGDESERYSEQSMSARIFRADAPKLIDGDAACLLLMLDGAATF